MFVAPSHKSPAMRLADSTIPQSVSLGIYIMLFDFPGICKYYECMGNPVFDTLKDKWAKKHAEITDSLYVKHKKTFENAGIQVKQVALAAVSGLSLMTSPVLPATAVRPPAVVETQPNATISNKAFLISDLEKVLPQDVRELTPEEDKQAIEIIQRNTGVKLTDSLQGIRLNRTYGYIGQEQHLALYPGDNIGIHFHPSVSSGPTEQAQEYAAYNMAPGLGAWGYFAPSKNDLTQTDIDREKYYIAVQTFLAPGFHDDVRRYITFFKYRKMLVVNPNNGRAMVVVIGDAGPGASTGKHLGGSPEVMRYLERFDGRQKGPVLYYFIDDPADAVPLGPVELGVS